VDWNGSVTGPGPSISVALATFNGSRFLPKQLASLANQEAKPLELVVVDDNSTDDTLQIVEQFSATAPFPVRIFKNVTQLGYRQNFMRATEFCSGDLVSFCDQDDIWSAEKLGRTASEFQDHNVLLTYHNARLIDGSDKPKGFVFKQSEKSATLSHEDVEPWRIVPGFAQTIRRSLLRHSNLHSQSRDMFDLEECMPHDQWFLFLASALGKIRYLAEPLAGYRLHDDNTSGWLPAKPLTFALHNIAYASYYVRASYNALQNRIQLMQTLKSGLPASRHGEIDAVIAHYALVSEYVHRRLSLYTEKSLRARARLLWSMIRDRTYNEPKVKFGRGSFLLDTVIGVPVGHTLR
jgi:glycosyltransferase involved in cell wall biosynthesis